MVVNAMMAAAAAHASPPPPPAGQQRVPKPPPTVYHATSSLRNPAPYAVLYRTGIRYFSAVETDQADQPLTHKLSALMQGSTPC